MTEPKIIAKFRPGSSIICPGVMNILPFIDLIALLRRHIQGDWGAVDEAQKAVNETALAKGGELISAYSTNATPEGKILFITAADRMYTTIALPSELTVG